jgi:hypothetical protein
MFLGCGRGVLSRIIKGKPHAAHVDSSGVRSTKWIKHSNYAIVSESEISLLSRNNVFYVL